MSLLSALFSSERLLQTLFSLEWRQISVTSSVVLWEFPFPWHCMTPIRRLQIWQAIGPNAVTDTKKTPSLCFFVSDIIVRSKGAKRRQVERITMMGRGGEPWEGIELKLKGSKERLMSVLQRDVFCRQPLLDCQLTELPIQASQKRSDRKADVLWECLEIRAIKDTSPLAV